MIKLNQNSCENLNFYSFPLSECRALNFIRPLLHFFRCAFQLALLNFFQLVKLSISFDSFGFQINLSLCVQLDLLLRLLCVAQCFDLLHDGVDFLFLRFQHHSTAHFVGSFPSSALQQHLGFGGEGKSALKGFREFESFEEADGWAFGDGMVLGISIFWNFHFGFASEISKQPHAVPLGSIDKGQQHVGDGIAVFPWLDWIPCAQEDNVCENDLVLKSGTVGAIGSFHVFFHLTSYTRHSADAGTFKLGDLQ